MKEFDPRTSPMSGDMSSDRCQASFKLTPENEPTP